MAKYPGHGRELRYMPESHDEPHYPIGAHQTCYGALSEILPVRELFMMLLMDKLMDKPDWHKKVFNDEIHTKWKKEALEMDEGPWYEQIVEGKTAAKLPQPRARFINSEIFDYCLDELQAKAKYFKQTGLAPTMDAAGNSVVKSDSLLPELLKNDLRAAFDKLRADQASNVDWHPQSNEQVQDLVHPSMYPFVYDRSHFLEDEAVGALDAVQKWSGKSGITLPKEQAKPPAPDRWRRYASDRIPETFWSVNYQWLPANLAFQEDGSVKFTSYVNNLHPEKYANIYKTIEKLIDISIPAWDQCLGRYLNDEKEVPGRRSSRFEQPGYCDDEMDGLWEEFDEALFSESVKTGSYQLDDWEEHNIEYDIRDSLEESEDPESPSPDVKAKLDAAREEAVKEVMWKKIRDPIIPMPHDDPKEINYTPQTSLRELFEESGLQVIVKMATIELTPEKPDFPMGSWHVEGQLNEHICATALYYLDSENVTPANLMFRMATSESTSEDIQTGQDSYNYLERIYGTGFGNGGECLQNYGSVETREGRLLAFPNVFQHRVSPFSLADPTKPGHRRFIALWLIDPHLRIISTANVPPQRLDWWAEATFGDGDKPKRGSVPPEVFQMLQEGGLATLFPQDKTTNQNRLPVEVMDMVSNEGVFPPSLMTEKEAKEHRSALMAERSQFHQDSEGAFRAVTYNFCEH